MKWKLIKEANKTPSDKESIDLAFKSVCGSERFLATTKFALMVYEKMNRELFYDALPDPGDVKFRINHEIRTDKSAEATCKIDRSKGIVSDFELTLNGNITLTLHEWLETILHEMIHILDYFVFTKHYKEDGYDPHGKWFNDQCRKFKKFGFNVDSTFKGEYGMKDSKTVMDKIGNEIFIQVGMSNDGTPEVFKIMKKNKDKFIEKLKGLGCKEVKILQTANPSSVTIRPISPSSKSPFSVYHLDNRFNKQFGPFDELETIDLTKLMIESDDEQDEYLKTLRSIKGLKSRKIGKHLYELTIS